MPDVKLFTPSVENVWMQPLATCACNEFEEEKNDGDDDDDDDDDNDEDEGEGQDTPPILARSARAVILQ